MSNHVYRFRSTHALLDGFNELEAQEIYFSPPEHLNDPLEGFKDIFWRGDHIVWHNLLRHYLLTVMNLSVSWAVMQQEFALEIPAALLHLTPDDIPDPSIRAMYEHVAECFFAHRVPNLLVDTLSSEARVVRRDELAYYLRQLQPLLMQILTSSFADQGLISQANSSDSLRVAAEKTASVLESVLRANRPETDVDQLFAALENTQSQMTLMQELSNPANGHNDRAWRFIARDIPGHYVNALERILYPDWSVACFVTDPTNSSMWGGYGDNHRGVCLKFSTQTTASGGQALTLRRRVGFSGNKNGIVETYDYVPHPFEQIRYTADFPEIDFFESIGALPKFKVEGFWFRSESGETSSTGSRLRSEDEAWRLDYWNRFLDSFRVKSPEWSHEQERRLTLYSMLQPFDEPQSRKLKYKFSDLAGIVFGIKTSVEDKLRIIETVRRKCGAEGRNTFEIQQAYYSHRSKRIELAPLKLLKFE
ncbi:DUF2971 domain-containing protein [Paraburkholderia sp. RL17-337-BIB-A]|uniref:DUF2971 domain-containing protein n=1 Tax=Paraburkholderia sp. RL17-337-BIB-A TaxID=3031636 RepID=UPI0038BC90D6